MCTTQRRWQDLASWRRHLAVREQSGGLENPRKKGKMAVEQRLSFVRTVLKGITKLKAKGFAQGRENRLVMNA